MSEQCDNKSVGIIIQNANKEILLLERARFPAGLAAPAGHVDDLGSLEEAAATEVWQEVGLAVPIRGLTKVIDNRRIYNQCRRGGQYHDWTVYEAESFSGTLNPSAEETKGAKWWPPEDLQALAAKTIAAGDMEQAQNTGNLLEGVWLNFLVELNYVCG